MRVSVWVCRLWVCIFASCVWMPDLLPPVGGGSSFALSLPTCQPESRGQLGQKPLLQATGNRRVSCACRGTVGQRRGCPRSRSPPSPRERVEVRVGRGACEFSFCPWTPAPGLRVRAVCCACVSLMQTLPPQTDPPNSLPFHTNLETGF